MTPTISSSVWRCLMCGYAPDTEEEEHLKAIVDEVSGVHVCVECVTRARTVMSFGLTVQELKIAAKEYKERWISNYMQQLPGGLCFAHGPYPGMNCPKFPACATDSQKPEYLAMAKTCSAARSPEPLKEG